MVIINEAESFVQSAKADLRIILISFGIKAVWGGQVIPQADHYIDCRFIANPAGLVNGTGDDKQVQDWVQANTNLIPETLQVLEESISKLPLRRRGKDACYKPFVVGCFCAFGVHRSRSMKHILANKLVTLGYQRVEVQ